MKEKLIDSGFMDGAQIETPEDVEERNRQLREYHQSKCPQCQQTAAQTRKEVAAWLEQLDRGWNPDQDYWFLPLIPYTALETLKRGESI